MGRCQERTGRLKGLESSLAPSAWALSSLPSSAAEGTKEGRATPPRTANGKPSPSSSSTSSSSSCSGPSSPSPSSRRATTHATGTTPKGWKNKKEPTEKVTLRDKSPKTRDLILLKMKAPLLVRSRRIRARSRASKASFLLLLFLLLLFFFFFSSSSSSSFLLLLFFFPCFLFFFSSFFSSPPPLSLFFIPINCWLADLFYQVCSYSA